MNSVGAAGRINPAYPNEGITENSSSCFYRCIELIVGIWSAAVGAIVFCSKWVIEKLSGYGSEQRQMMDKLAVLAENSDSLIEKMYLDELRSQVGSKERTLNPISLVQTIEGTGKRLEKLAIHVESSIDTLADLAAADEFYRDSMEEFIRLQDLPLTQVQRALYTGRLTNSFRRLDDRFSDIEGTTLHRYCGCHIQPEEPIEGITGEAPGISHQKGKFDVAHPEEQNHDDMPAHASTVILSWSLGGGHNVVQHAMSQRLGEKGAHAYKVEADKEVVEGFYNFRKWTGYSGIEWGDYFLQNGYWATTRFLSWFSYGKESIPSREEKIKKFFLSLLSRGDQDAAIMCFQAHTCHAEKAANRLGMACYDVATDLDYRVFHFEKDVENPHFKHAVMVADPQRQSVELHHQLHPEHIVEGGFPVRDGFFKEYSAQEIEELREKYRVQYGLTSDARVVILLCGGVGTPNTFAETLADHYSKELNAPPIHLFAICGNNEPKKEALKGHFDGSNHSKFQGTALGWLDDSALGELFALGALDEQRRGYLVSPKGGGGTISEAIARGIPTLVYDTTGFPHEQMNIAFLVENNLGTQLSSEAELPALLAKGLQAPFNPSPSPTGESFSRFNSKQKSMDNLAQLIASARGDAEFQSRKPSNIVLPSVTDRL